MVGSISSDEPTRSEAYTVDVRSPDEYFIAFHPILRLHFKSFRSHFTQVPGTMGGYAYTSLGSTVSAMWYQRRRRGLVALVAAVIVLVVAAHASLFAEKDQYHHAFTHVASAFPSLRRAALTFDTRLGLAEVDEGKMTVHPIRELIERAHMLYEEQQRKIQSIRTLEDAVEDYKRAFKMDPPRGFDTWYVHLCVLSGSPKDPKEKYRSADHGP